MMQDLPFFLCGGGIGRSFPSISEWSEYSECSDYSDYSQFFPLLLTVPLRQVGRAHSAEGVDGFRFSPLREIKIKCFLFFCTQRAQRAQSFYALSCFTLALKGSQTSLRQECAERWAFNVER